MKRQNKVTRLWVIFVLVLGSLAFSHPAARAGGISIDAGLTPAADRWIFRSQVRILQRNNNPAVPSMEMEANMFPIMVAYGLRSDAMIMVRQSYMRREMTMMGQSTASSGLGDLLILGKYRLTRINTSTYTLGIAPTLGLEFPTGESPFTSDSYDLRLGMLFSGRSHSWGMDLNLTYAWNGMVLGGGSNVNPGDEIAVQAAVSRQLSMGDNADISIAPVLESSYRKAFADNNDSVTISNTGESLFLVAPGLKLTWGSFVLEGLVQFPVWQEHEGSQTERSPSVLLGMRLMN